MDWFLGIDPVLQALLATTFTWLLTAGGAAVALFGRTIRRRTLDGALGFASGVMIAASFWSLLAPAIEMAEQGPLPGWVPAALGFLGGGLFLFCVDKLLPHVHPGISSEHTEGIKTSWQRTTLLVLAVTLHNIPEGIATALPLCKAGICKRDALKVAFLSGLAEPAGALLASMFLVRFTELLPAALAFAGGVMVFITLDELIPTARKYGNENYTALGIIAGSMFVFVLTGIFGV